MKLRNFGPKILSTSWGGRKPKSSFLESNFLTWSILILFLFKIISLLFIFNFPQSIFFADINKVILLNLTNGERKILGFNPLKENSKLNQAAYLKAKDMLENDYFAHTSPQGLSPWYWFSSVGYDYQYAGENLAIDFVDSEELFQAWDNSPSHRENIINPNYNDIGIAVLTGEFKGSETTVVVQLFGSPKKALAKEPLSSTPKRAPAQKPVPKAISTGETLYGYYIKRGERFPSFKERAILYEKYGLGPAIAYKGTAEQNTALLNKLIAAEKLPPEEEKVAKKQEEEIKPKEEKPKEIVGIPKPLTSQEKKSFKFRFIDFMSRYYDDLTQKISLVALVIVIISIFLEVFIKTKVRYGDLFLKGTFYTFVLLVLFILDKELILELIPHTLEIF